MDLYEANVLVHIAAAVALLSSSVVASPGIRRAVRRARTVQELQVCLAIGRPLLVLEPASAVVVLVTGIYLTNVAGFWTQGWVQVAAAAWVVNAMAAAMLVKPAMASLSSAAEASTEGQVGRDLDGLRWSFRWSIGGDVLLATDASMLYLMTMKPGLTGSLLVAVLANVAVAAVRGARRLRRARAVLDSAGA